MTMWTQQFDHFFVISHCHRFQRLSPINETSIGTKIQAKKTVDLVHTITTWSTVRFIPTILVKHLLYVCLSTYNANSSSVNVSTVPALFLEALMNTKNGCNEHKNGYIKLSSIKCDLFSNLKVYPNRQIYQNGYVKMNGVK